MQINCINILLQGIQNWKKKPTQYGVFFSSQALVADRLRGCVGETIEHSGGNITKARQNVTAWVTE